jgi:hypothetical protein
LRAPVERISTLAGLDLDELASDLEPFDRRKARDGFALGLDAEARSAPPGGYDRLRRLAAPPMPPGRKAEVYGADGTVAVWRGV